MKKYKDIIFGAGITGLSYACFCGHDEYLILERDSEIGGYCKTVKRGGFVWDYSGHFFHFRRPEIEAFLREGTDPSTILKVVKHTQIAYKDKYVDFPFQKNIHQLDKDEFIDCLYDFYFRDKDKHYSSFKEMLFAKLGRSISEKFLIPYNEKLYVCDVNSLDHGAMGRFFPEVTLDGIIGNFKESDNPSYNDTFTYFSGGAVEYVNSLKRRVPSGKIHLSEAALDIDIDRKIVQTGQAAYSYDRIISSVPFPRLMDLCHLTYDQQCYSWNKVLVFNLGFDRKGNDDRNHWIYFPESRYTFYRVGYYDNILNQDRMSLYVEIGFSKDESVDVKAIFQRMMEDLKLAGIVTNQRLLDHHFILMDPAYVHIRSDSLADIPLRMKQLEKKDVYSIGRYGGWKYCSIEDNMIEAKGLAQRLGA